MEQIIGETAQNIRTVYKKQKQREKARSLVGKFAMVTPKTADPFLQKGRQFELLLHLGNKTAILLRQ